MRFFLWTTGIVLVVLAVLAFVFMQVISSQDEALRVDASATPTPSAVATTAPPLTEEEKLDRQIATNVNLYGQLVCDKLAEQPDADINLLVDKFIETYGLGGTAPEQQRPTAQRLLTDASAQFCPDQSPRIAAAFAE
jgi:hypothetical protein